MKPTGIYEFLNKEPGPMMLLEGLKLYGTIEIPGKGINPTIVNWADEVASYISTPYTRWAADWYNDDDIPWCGLYMALIACRSNPNRLTSRMPPDKYLSAIAWAQFGKPVPLDGGMLGDIGVKKRPGGAHVFIIVGEDKTAYHGLGGNTKNDVSIARMLKKDVVAVRRTPYLNTPSNIRKIILPAQGGHSKNEA